MGQALFRPQKSHELPFGVQRHPEAALIEGGGGLGVLRQTPVARILVVPPIGHLALHLLHDVVRRGDVGVTDAQADDIHPTLPFVGDLLLDTREEIRGQVVHPVREPHVSLLVGRSSVSG